MGHHRELPSGDVHAAHGRLGAGNDSFRRKIDALRLMRRAVAHGGICFDHYRSESREKSMQQRMNSSWRLHRIVWLLIAAIVVAAPARAAAPKPAAPQFRVIALA